MTRYLPIAFALLAALALWWNHDIYVTEYAPAIGPAPQDLKRIMRKVGPLYRYRLSADGVLRVWQRGEWLIIRKYREVEE